MNKKVVDISTMYFEKVKSKIYTLEGINNSFEIKKKDTLEYIKYLKLIFKSEFEILIHLRLFDKWINYFQVTNLLELKDTEMLLKKFSQNSELNNLYMYVKELAIISSYYLYSVNSILNYISIEFKYIECSKEMISIFEQIELLRTDYSIFRLIKEKMQS